MDEQKLIRKKRRALEENNFLVYDSTVNTLCTYYSDERMYQEALNMFKEVSNVYKNRPQFRMERGRAERMIGEMFTNLGNYPEAVAHVEIYIKIAKQEQNTLEEQRAYATMGRTYMLHATNLTDPVAIKEPLNKSNQAFFRSLAICKSKKLSGIRRMELLEMEARLYLNIGIVKELQEEYDEAEKYMEMALSLCRDNDLFDLLYRCYLTSAEFMYNKRSDVTKALRLLNLGMVVAERLDRGKNMICEVLLQKSVIFIKLGDFHSAKQVLRKAYKTQTTIPEDRKRIQKELKTVAAICNAEDELISTDSDDYVSKKRLFEKLGDGACHLMNYSKAIDYYLNMLKFAEKSFMSEKELIPTYVSLYQTYIDLKQYESALLYMWKEYELVKDNASEAKTTLLSIANVYELSEKDFWSIEDIYQRARSECQDICEERIVLLKQIALREKHQMNTLVEILREEAVMMGINLDSDEQNNDEKESGSENEESLEKNTPDIGHDICLDELSGGSDSEEERPAEKQPRSAIRRRGKSIAFKRNEKGETPVHIACISGNINQLKRLLDQGHAVNIRDNAGWMPLHEAANYGHTDIVKLLIERGAPINDKGGQKCDGITALHDACGNGNLEVIEALLDAGANATLLTDFRDTPYQSLQKWRQNRQLDAVEQNYYDTVRARLMESLQKAGNKIDSQEDSEDLLPSARRRTPNRKPNALAKSVVTSSDGDSESTQRITINKILEKEFPALQRSDNDDSDSDTCERTMINREDYNGKINVNDYRNVMENLRHPAPISPSKSVSDSNKRRLGLLTPDEVGENWLDNDIIFTTKKRKLTGEDMQKIRPSPKKSTITSRSSSTHSSQQSKENNHPNVYVSPLKKSMADSEMSTTPPFVIDDNSTDAFDMMMYPVASSSVAPKRKSLNLSRDTSKKKQQKNSLKNMGFIQVKHTSVSQDNSDCEDMVNSSNIGDSVTLTSPHIPSMTSVKVKVNELLFNVPINKDIINDLTIGWLAEETSRRYYNLKGLQPVLQITTNDGAVFENSDPLSVTLGATVGSNVLEWNLPSLSQRYLESCRLLKTGPDEYIKTQLEMIQATHHLSLTDQFLEPIICKTVFKSLHYQSNLDTIDLSNNFLQDEGCRYLAEALPTLEKLKVLNLNGNHITSIGISALSTKLPSNSLQTFALETLSLSFNPLGNASAVHLSLLVGHLRNLRVLHLSSVDMTEFSSINLSSITDLDISLTHLRLAELSKILKQLNACKVERLNIAFSVHEQGAGMQVASFLQNGTLDGLQYLNLTGLSLDDGDVYEIVQPLRRARQLDELILIENKSLSAIVFKMMLQKLCVKWLQIGGCPSGLGNLDVTDVEDVIQCQKVSVRVSERDGDCETESLTRLWRRFYGDRALITVHQRNVVLSIDSV